ncbi:M13-type metalloendopeptidase [Lacticaseibacillus thailandensis]|uniref:Neutral endopeptidase n=1 Tax=Lacticaseibacillus thailandensis DSM 22698 = JCM 13996 TaxID=1423810 RepID=A0A0R2CJD9_9LACO|nr:M13 family metallopeptidase [Lacticaseibacillus thailandensis]KRM88380.1 neutral endopeptidase [Lacticaseibacillus thailandensis DSM 22698 = JCM 13996]
MTVRPADDLYMAVNGAWQAQTVIPPDKAQIGADSDLGDEIRAKLVRDLRAINAGTIATADQSLLAAARLFVLADDREARNRLGVAPIRTRVDYLMSLQDVGAWRAALPTLWREQYPLPLSTFVMADFHDATVNMLNVSGPDPILPDAAMYQETNADNDAMFAAWSQMARTLLAAVGITGRTADRYVDDALNFDRRAAALLPTNEEFAVDTNWDHPLSWQDFAEVTADTTLATALATVLPNQPVRINTPTPRYVAALDRLVTADNYGQWQHMAVIQELIDHSRYLSDELRQAAGAYQRYLSGQPQPTEWHKHAFAVANEYLAEPIGIYYGRTYFGAAAKRDITGLVRELIAQYEVQLQNNTWLSPSTRDQAIAKLKTMRIKMGYPDHAAPVYQHLHVDPDADLLGAMVRLEREETAYRWSTVGQPVDRSEWQMPGHLVNACYDPSMNDITFPAGILQPPFYALYWSRAAKLGGTGATIGHEISHSFDNNGAMFDEHGTMNNWWQEADKVAFDHIVDAVAQQFDGRHYEGVPVNGRLTVSENMADNAGMDVALAVLGPDASVAALREFFTAYARSWATKMRPERAKTVLRQDVHAPATLRVNVPVMNFSEWYRAYGAQPGDGEYLPPAQRVVIWDR